MDFYRKTPKLFWIVQIVFWFVYLVVNMIFAFFYCPQSHRNLILNFEFKFLSTISGIVYSIILQYLCYRLRQQKVSYTLIIISLAPLSYFLSIAWAFQLELLYSNLYKSVFYLSFQNYILHGFDLFFILISICVFYFLMNYWQELQIERENKLKAEALAHQSQLQMLRYQLNPHFLFNALNSVRALTDENTEKARQIISDLSEFLRYSLINKTNSEVQIKEEVNAIEKYLEIQKFRYEEKLSIFLDIDERVAYYKIPCFIIHPLVENAIKYGMQTSPLPLEIKIEIKSEKDLLTIKVTNSGRLIEQRFPKQDGTGLGLDNIKQRLEILFPGKNSFKIIEQNNYVVATIEIQFQNN